MLTNLLIALLGRRRAWRLGRRMYMQARGEVGNSIAFNGEAELIRQMARAHRSMGSDRAFHAIDIGANRGEWTHSLIDSMGNLAYSVDIFEPVPSTLDSLRADFATCPPVRIHAAAVSDHVGTATMHIVGQAAGTNSLDGASFDIAGGSLEVALTTLPIALTEMGYPVVDLVKIDVEGHDIVILRSLGDVLRSATIGAIQFEYNWRWLANGGSLYEVFAMIEGTGYRLARVAKAGPIIINSWNPEIDRFLEANYVLLSPSTVAVLNPRSADWDANNTTLFS